MLGAATIITQANAGPPGYITWAKLPQNLNDGKSTRGEVDIEIVNDVRGIKLIIPMRPKPSSGE